MKRYAFNAAAACLAMMACQASPQRETTSPTAQPDGPRPPMVLQVLGPTAGEVPEKGSVEVEFSLVRTPPNAVPMNWDLSLPHGAVLLGGSLKEVVTDPTSPVVTRRFRLGYSEIPAADAVVQVRVEGAGYGATSKAVYRFGRPEPALPPLVRSGPVLPFHGKPGGQGIPVSPKDDVTKSGL